MDKIWLKIKPIEPLLLGGVKANTNFLSALPYIPGRVLRGVWADWLIEQGREQDILAHTEQVRIGNFFPAADWQTIHSVSPFLLSTLSCKRERGFYNVPGNPKERKHGVVDTLLPHLAYRLLQDKGADFSVPFALRCNVCSDRMEVVKGFYAVYQRGHNIYYTKTQERYYGQTKVALNPYRQAGAEGMLYTATALSPLTVAPDNPRMKTDLVFIGQVNGPEGKIEELCEALNIMPIGSLRTRGYGQIKVQTTSAPKTPDLVERLEKFNQQLVRLWQDLKRLVVNSSDLPDKPEGTYFSVDLVSPGIFHQKGLPSLIPSLDWDVQFLKPVFWLTRPGFAGGWSIVWGLPKFTALVAQMGSVYVFRWDGPQETLIPRLEELENKGVGERCDEGFGECLVCHPVHEEIDEK
jgi:CRISPR-associated protein Csx10